MKPINKVIQIFEEMNNQFEEEYKGNDEELLNSKVLLNWKLGENIKKLLEYQIKIRNEMDILQKKVYK